MSVKEMQKLAKENSDKVLVRQRADEEKYAQAEREDEARRQRLKNQILAEVRRATQDGYTSVNIESLRVSTDDFNTVCTQLEKDGYTFRGECDSRFPRTSFICWVKL